MSEPKKTATKKTPAAEAPVEPAAEAPVEPAAEAPVKKVETMHPNYLRRQARLKQ